jgi:glycosyltransferase involved in cell wall biosynthesis
MAKVFIFPSLYEGFGIPPLEALSCGTNVISSNSTAMPEILGEYATYFESNRTDDLMNVIINYYNGNIKTHVFKNKIYKWNIQAENLCSYITGI